MTIITLALGIALGLALGAGIIAAAWYWGTSALQMCVRGLKATSAWCTRHGRKIAVAFILVGLACGLFVAHKSALASWYKSENYREHLWKENDARVYREQLGDAAFKEACKGTRPDYGGGFFTPYLPDDGLEYPYYCPLAKWGVASGYRPSLWCANFPYFCGTRVTINPEGSGLMQGIIKNAKAKATQREGGAQ